MGYVALTGFISAIKQAQIHSIKPIELSQASKAYKDNVKGTELFTMGKFRDAASAFDDASVADQDSPVPWLNGGLTAKELGKLGIAKLAVNTAFHLGDKSARGKVISAEVDLARKQFEPAKAKLGQALFMEPNDPYALSEFGKWNRLQSHLREGERFMWQSFREGAPVVMNSKFHNEANYSASGGVRDASLLTSGQMVGSDAMSSFDAGFTAQTVSGDALQQLTKLDFAMDTQFGVFAGNHRALQSDRPGSSSPSLLLPATPGSRLDLRHTMLGWQKRLGDLTFHANYRQEFSSLRTLPAGPFAKDNRMHQYIFEARYDSGQWMTGGGYSKVSKDSVATPGIEPLEELFPQGTTNLYNAYAVNRQSLNKNVKLTSGGIFTSARGVDQGALMAQLAIHTFGDRYIKFGVKPGINRVQTNLGPINDMSSSLGSNSMDRLFGSALEFNRDISLPAVNSRMSNIYAAVPLAGSMVLNAFRTSFTNQFFVGTEPQTSNSLNLTRVSNGSVTGFGIEDSFVLSNSTGMRLSATLQSSNGTYAGPTWSLDSGGVQPVKMSEIPNIPRFEASASFDWSSRNSTVALSAHYVGSRSIVQQPSEIAALPPGSYFSRANAVVSLDAHFSFVGSGSSSFELSILNLANNNFYPGFRSSRQVMLGFTSRQ